MAEIKNRVDWRTLIRRIKTGKLTPFLSDKIGSNRSLKNHAFVQAWAKEIGYPMKSTQSLTRVAQFKSVTKDTLAAKEDYLDFSKRQLLEIARQKNVASQSAFLDTLEDELYDLSFSQVAVRLKYPDFENETDNPLRILAELPVPIFITTSYHTFLGEALKAAGKEPQMEICRWKDDLESIPSLFDSDDFEPTVQKPVVYHLHGLDSDPSSLVLTEDDYLDFLVKVAQDTQAVPSRIGQALADSSLLLLDYDLQDWDFRVLFRGLIKPKPFSRRLMSISLQLTPERDETEDMDEVENFLKKYFGDYKFEVYWGDAQTFVQELWQQWETQS